MPKIKDKERIIKAAREKERVTYKSSHKIVKWFLKRNVAGYKELLRGIQSDESKDLHPRLLHPAKLSFRMEGKIKCFPDKVKLKEFIITQHLLYEMLKGFI